MNADLASVRDRARRLVDDFPYYAENCLTIRTKADRLAPLVLNRVQREVHSGSRLSSALPAGSGR